MVGYLIITLLQWGGVSLAETCYILFSYAILLNCCQVLEAKSLGLGSINLETWTAFSWLSEYT